MDAWVRLDQPAVEDDRLPAKWDLIREPTSGHFAVVGRSGSATVDVVIRLDYAVDTDGADIRSMVGSAIIQGLEARRPPEG